MKRILLVGLVVVLGGCAVKIPKTDVSLGIVKTEAADNVGVAVSLTGTCTGILSAFGAESYCTGVQWLVNKLVK